MKFKNKLMKREFLARDIEQAVAEHRFRSMKDKISRDDINIDPYFDHEQVELTQEEKEDPVAQAYSILFDVEDITGHEKGRIAYDRDSMNQLKAWDDIRRKYYDAKWDWYLNKTDQAMLTSTADLESAIFEAREDERTMMERMEYMYQKFDYDSDRSRIRARIARDDQKKVTLRDIADILDRSTKLEKAINDVDQADWYDTEPKNGSRDVTSDELIWSNQILKGTPHGVPNIFEDQSYFEGKTDDEIRHLKTAIEEVRIEDTVRDHSYEALNEEEKLEIEIFKNFKRDPFYKHYIHNSIRQQADNFNQISVASDIMQTGVRM